MKKELLTISLILLSGCVKMNSTQEFNRDGTINVIVLVNSPYFTLLEAINDSIIPNPELSHFSERINNTLLYYFRKADPFSQDLFLSSNLSGDLDINPSGFLGGNTFKYRKEFKFPYYYYYYSADFGQASIEAGEEFNKSKLLNMSTDQEVTYDLIYFGELVSTNGEELAVNKVRFYANDSKLYNLTFKEFFLNNWLMRLTE